MQKKKKQKKTSPKSAWKRSLPKWVIAALAVVLAALLAALFWFTYPQKQVELPYLTATHIAILDLNTGKFVCREDSDEPRSPASITKLMTIYLILDDIGNGTLDWEDEYLVMPEDAFAPGSKYGMEPGEVFTVRQLVAGTLLSSGCDCVHCLVALSAGGDEAAFVARMNEKAQDLGLKGSHFSNATGIDAADHYMTAENIARLAQSLLEVHPEVLDFTARATLEIDGRYFSNMHRLVGWDSRVLGLKTGTTTIGGYNLVTYAQQDGQAYLIVLLDSNNDSTRFSETEAIVDILFGEA